MNFHETYDMSEMGYEWLDCTLADACAAINYGLTASASPDPDGPKFLRITDIVGSSLDWTSVPHVPVDSRESEKFRLSDGDIVLARTGASTGASAYIKDPPTAVFASYLVRLKTKRNFDSRYISYYLKSPSFRNYINGVLGDKSAQPNASASTMAAAPLRCPRDLGVQRRIAHILGALDDKIELNRRMNETLEGMARAVFKDWFVDFGPVRAKVKGREAYLPEEVWRLFPERLVESELGLVPEGWGVRRLGDCYDLTMGQSPPGHTYNDDGEGVPFFQGRTDFGFRYPTNRRYCTAPTRFAEADDTLVSVRAPVGDINMAWERCCVGRGLAALRHKSRSRSFTYYSALAIQDRFRDYEHTGTVFGSINKQQFEALEVVVPGDILVATFENQVGSLDSQVRNNTSDMRVIAATRDALLPVLVSGELRLDW